MTLPFALRSRIRFRDEPVRARSLRVPPLAAPVAAYWAIMGVLTYGVASGALRPERVASLHLLPSDSFTSSRILPERDTTPAGDEAHAPREEPATEGTVKEAPSIVPSAAPTSEPLAVAAPAPAEPPPEDPAPQVAARTAVRPLSGFSLIAPIQDDDGDRGSYAAEEHELAEFHAASGADRSDANDVRPRAPRDEPPALALREARAAAVPGPRAPAVFRPRERELVVPMPGEWKPAARSGVALRSPDRNGTRAFAVRRADPNDPYPGYRDDDAPARPRPDEPKPREPETRDDERPSRSPPPPAARGVSTCEAVMATANEEMDLTKSRGASAPDLTRGAYASVLERGGYLLPCGVPAGMTLDVCAAVRDGRAVGITVVTHPADARVVACVRNAVAALPFPRSSRLDVTRTHFGAAR